MAANGANPYVTNLAPTHNLIIQRKAGILGEDADHGSVHHRPFRPICTRWSSGRFLSEAASQMAGLLKRRGAVHGVRRAKAALFCGCKSHPAKLLQPEATGATMEVTKWLKPSGKASHEIW